MSTYHQCDRCQSMISVRDYIDNEIKVGNEGRHDLCRSCFHVLHEYIKSWIGE